MLIALFLRYPLISIIYIVLVVGAIIHSSISLQRIHTKPEQIARILLQLLVVCAIIVAFYLVVIIGAIVIDG